LSFIFCCRSKASKIESLFWWRNNITEQTCATELADLPH